MKTITQLLLLLGTTTLLATTLFSHGVGRSQSSPLQKRPALAQNAQPTSVNAEIALFGKASSNFLRGDRYQTESKMQVTGKTANASFSMNFQLSSVVQSPNKFRNEITFLSDNNTIGQKASVISDGKQVWIYRPDLKQYSVSSYQKFDQSDDTFFIGLSAILYLQIPPDVRQILAQSSLTDPKVLAELGLQNALKSSKQVVAGQTLHAYEYTDTKEGYQYSALIDPQTAAVRQLQVRGKSEGMNITITETILRRTPAPAIKANTFTFSPPQGSKQVEKLSISPF